MKKIQSRCFKLLVETRLNTNMKYGFTTSGEEKTLEHSPDDLLSERIIDVSRFLAVIYGIHIGTIVT